LHWALEALHCGEAGTDLRYSSQGWDKPLQIPKPFYSSRGPKEGMKIACPQPYPLSAEGRHQEVTASCLLLPGVAPFQCDPHPLSRKRRCRLISSMQCFTRASQAALVVKNPPASEGDTRDARLIPGSGRSPGEGNGNPLQYSHLEKPTDRGA